MSALAVGAIVFGCVFGGALPGLRPRIALPDRHLGVDTKDVVKLSMGLVATMTALILGLFAPSDGTVVVALMVASLSVAGSIFLILELDQPFGGVIRIPSTALRKTLEQLGN